MALAEPNYLYAASETPDDSYFPQLWGMNNLGQSVSGIAGLADADIDAPEAWDLTRGSADVKVAVLDSGVAGEHPDLAPNMLPGRDVVNADANPEDADGHGTHVAATIGARGNNGVGVAGVAWNVGIIPVRVLGGDGFGTTADLIDGIAYAAGQGADIVNLSLGSPQYSQALANAIAARPNILFVAAAGNGGEDSIGDNADTVPEYPCSYPSANIVCVAATDQSDRLAGFSNYGVRNVDLAAPGTRVLSAAPAAATVFTSGFEEISPPWTTGGTSEWRLVEDSLGWFASDSPGRNYSNNADAWLDSDLFSLAGKRGCNLNLWLYLDTEFEYDGLLVEATTNGTDYTAIAGWTGWSEEWLPLSVPMPAYDGRGQVGISFRLMSDGDTVADGAEIDDVSVDCVASSYGPDDYAVMQGTSMATPHVTGVAALLLSAKPTASVAELRQALLGGVDRKTSLVGKVASDGRLNAFNSLRLLAPATPPPGATPTPSPSPTPGPSATPTPPASPVPTEAPVDGLPPVLTSVRDVPDPFSPNGDGIKDVTKISWVADEPASTSIAIYRKSGKRIRTLGTYDLGAGGWFVKWNGKTGSGHIVKPGTYVYEIVATDDAGNEVTREGTTTIK